MIIPPDPEKDPRLFAESLTPSLLPPSSDLSSDLTPPEAAHLRNHPYQIVLEDGSQWEALPPYTRRRSGDPTPLTSVTSFDDSIIQRRSQPLPRIAIPRSSTDIYSSSPSSDGSITPTASSSRLPIVNPAAGPVTSTTKLWESSNSTNSSFGKPEKRRFLGIPISRSPLATSTKSKTWWKKWKRWMYAIFGFLFVGIGLMIGLLVGWKNGLFTPAPPAPAANSWGATDGYNGQRSTQWTPSTNSNLNFTWTPPRDNPPAAWGVMSQCNNFMPLIATNLSELSVPFPSNTLNQASFSIPLSNITNTTDWTLPADLFIYSTGLASAGTVEFVGSDAPLNVIMGGTEGQITVDVVVRYGGPQPIEQMMQICEMSRPTGAIGVGIFTPEITDGKISSVYQLDPTQLPQFQVTVRMPPSVINGSRSLALPNIDLMLERMAVRFGNMASVTLGTVNITQGRGGVVAGYVAAETVSVVAGQNAVIGKYNVSDSLYMNVTAGSIIADVILWDPLNPNTTASLPAPEVARRGPPPPPLHNVSVPVTQLFTNATPNHTIETTFVTTEGYVNVAYLQQPPRTALQATVSTGQGAIDVSLHPNFIGPFAIRNNWGMVRLPPPTANLYDDPEGLGRKRYVSEGPINTPPDSIFAAWGVNNTALADSGQVVAGAAYWGQAPAGPSGPETPIAIQLDPESQGSQLMIAGAWGDISLWVDGT